MIGYLVVLCKAVVKSPMQKSKAMEKAMVNMPLSKRAITMLWGTTMGEFFTSSPIQ